MATKKEIHELIGRIVADPDFRAGLADDPEKAVKDAGYELTDEQMNAVMKADIKTLGEDLEDRFSKSAFPFFMVPE
jgi:H2-forming N5,N10-methylenetetrahydromethanopterin dehydrogenase-like enzyme